MANGPTNPRDTVAPTQPPPPKASMADINRGLPSPMRQRISEGFIGMGAAMLGGGLAQQFDNPELAKVGAQQGQEIIKTLRTEWQQKQAENFRQMHGKRFMEQMQSLQNEYDRKTELHTIETGQVDPETGEPLRKMGFMPMDYEGSPKPGTLIEADSLEAFQHLQQSAEDFYRETGRLSMQFLDTASQYPDNPFINQMASGLVNFMNQQAGYAATGRKEASEQLSAMQEQETTRLSLEQANEDLIQARMDRQVQERAQEAAVREAKIVAPTNSHFQSALKAAGLPTQPNKWSKEQGRDAAALLSQLRAEEIRQSELLRKSPSRRFAQMTAIAPDTPLNQVGAAVEASPLYEANLETAQSDIGARFEQQIENVPAFQKQIEQSMLADPTGAQASKLKQELTSTILASPAGRTIVKTVAKRDSLAQSYALNPDFRNRVDQRVSERVAAGEWERPEGSDNLEVFIANEYPQLLPAHVSIDPKTGDVSAKTFDSLKEFQQFKERQQRRAAEAARKKAEAELDTEKRDKKKKAKPGMRFTAEGEAKGVERYRELSQAIHQVELAIQGARGKELKDLQQLRQRLYNERRDYPSPTGSLLRRGGEVVRGLFETEHDPEAERGAAVRRARGLLGERGERLGPPRPPRGR